MDQATNSLTANRGTLTNVIYIVVAVLVLYGAYSYMFGEEDTSEVTIQGPMIPAKDPQPWRSTSKPKLKLPSIFTGGEMTLMFWMFVDEWSHKAGRMKHVLTLGPMTATGQPGKRNVAVFALYPMENKMMIRVRTVPTNATGGNATGVAAANAGGMAAGVAPVANDFTDQDNLNSLLVNNNNVNMFMNTVDYPLCDLPEFDLQKWIHVSLVVSGSVADVYLDGKLSRSCVLPNIMDVPSGNLMVTLADKEGFGGAISKVKMSNFAATPDRIYQDYMGGPEITATNYLDKLLGALNLRVVYSSPRTVQDRPPSITCDVDNKQVPGFVTDYLHQYGLNLTGK